MNDEGTEMLGTKGKVQSLQVVQPQSAGDHQWRTQFFNLLCNTSVLSDLASKKENYCNFLLCVPSLCRLLLDLSVGPCLLPAVPRTFSIKATQWQQPWQRR